MLLTIVLSSGGGLYEILVVYPNWRNSKTAHELKHNLQSSGQNYAGTRFWPLSSPAQALLSIINLIMAFRYDGAGHNLWLVAAILVFVTRLITFGYFIPVMLSKIMKADQIPAEKLPGIVKQWITLSPLRLITEFAALILGTWALLHLAVVTGIV